MKLYPNPLNDDGTRSWRGRRHNYFISISEVFNHKLGYVDKYTFHIKKGAVCFDFKSSKKFDTVEDCKNHAIQTIEDHKVMLKTLRRPLRKGGGRNAVLYI